LDKDLTTRQPIQRWQGCGIDGRETGRDSPDDLKFPFHIFPVRFFREMPFEPSQHH
jgi:hypothetical protein